MALRRSQEKSGKTACFASSAVIRMNLWRTYLFVRRAGEVPALALGACAMIHYSCDLCKRPLDPDDDLRYVLKMEVYAAFDPLEMDDGDADRDNLQELHEIMERMDDAASDEIGDDVYQNLRFD